MYIFKCIHNCSTKKKVDKTINLINPYTLRYRFHPIPTSLIGIFVVDVQHKKISTKQFSRKNILHLLYSNFIDNLISKLVYLF